MKEFSLVCLVLALVIAGLFLPRSWVAAQSVPTSSENCVPTGMVNNINYYWCEGMNGAPDYLANSLGFTQIP